MHLHFNQRQCLRPTQDSDTNPNTTATSDAEGYQPDGRKRRIDAGNLRKSVLGKKHSRLDESKVLLYLEYPITQSIY